MNIIFKKYEIFRISVAILHSSFQYYAIIKIGLYIKLITNFLLFHYYFNFFYS